MAESWWSSEVRMNQVQNVGRCAGVIALLLCIAGMAEGQLNFARESQNPPRETVSGQTADTTAGPTAETQGEPALVIENDSDLPDTYPRGVYGVRLRVRGGVPVFRWK